MVANVPQNVGISVTKMHECAGTLVTQTVYPNPTSITTSWNVSRPNKAGNNGLNDLSQKQQIITVYFDV